MSKLCIGTVQFGMKYGVNNAIGRKPSRQESFEMLDYALTHGIDTIDTARAYGDAELLLGEYFRNRQSLNHIKIISKLRPNVIEKGEKDIAGVMRREIEESLDRMSITSLDGYLLHTPEYIYNAKIQDALCSLKEQNYVKNIGVSIYNIEDGYAAIKTGIVNYMQLPYSILDQRGIKTGMIQEAKKLGITIFTRSAFLQGLFMMPQTEIPDYLQQVCPYLNIFDRILGEYGVDKVSALLRFVTYEKDIDYLVFGVEKKEQLEENIMKAVREDVPDKCILELKKQIGEVGESIIFPSLWANGRRAE